MSVFIVDPYYPQSHRYWGEFLACHLPTDVYIFQSDPVHWKWRMEAGAIELAKQVQQHPEIPQTFLATDYLNLALFKSLLPDTYQHCTSVLYMHENQLSYPVSDHDTDIVQQRDNHYGWINYTSCLVADRILFNSQYHFDSFFRALEDLSSRLPEPISWSEIKLKSAVLYIPFDIEPSPLQPKRTNKTKRIVWNHRWDYDKRPQVFLATMHALAQEGHDFELILLGDISRSKVKKYKAHLDPLSNHIVHQGYVDSKATYLDLLGSCDMIVSTAIHDFFGISIVEGILAGCQPIVPKDLAYPEWIADDLKGRVFYGQGRTLKELLKSEWMNTWTTDDISICRALLYKKLDWNELKSRYEEILIPLR